MVEIISQPELKTIRVTDIDIGFLGQLQQWTLHPQDSIAYTDDAIVLTIAPREIPPQRLSNGSILPARMTPGETVNIYKRNVLWVSSRERDIIIPEPADGTPAHRKE